MTAIVSNKKFLLAATPLFLILFIDSMGLGLVIPLLNTLIVNPQSGFFPTGLSMNMRNFIFGSTMGVFMLCWFFGASFLGDLSDQIGRKKSLLICLIGAFGGYILSAIGVMVDSYLLLLFGRIIAGFTAGSQAIAQAAIVDISPPEHKARNIGLILFFVSLGFIFGPLLGGVLSDAKLESWFSLTTPFYFAALLAFINTFLLWYFFHETFHRKSKVKIKLHGAIEIFFSAFRHEKIRALSLILLIMILGWSSFFNFIAMFLLREYNFNTLNIALYLTLMGVGFGVGTGLLVEYFTQRYQLKNIVVLGSTLGALATLIIVAGSTPIFAWIAIAPLAIAMAVVYSVLLTIFSNQVDANSQGWIMGVTGAIMAFAFGIDGILVGLLTDFSPKIPLIITVVGLLITAFLMYFYQNGHNENIDSAL